MEARLRMLYGVPQGRTQVRRILLYMSLCSGRPKGMGRLLLRAHRQTRTTSALRLRQVPPSHRLRRKMHDMHAQRTTASLSTAVRFQEASELGETHQRLLPYIFGEAWYGEGASVS